VTYTYDHSGDTKGTLYSVTTSAGNGTVYTHDKIGRVTGSTQTTASVSYPFTYQYSLTDILTQVGYPSGQTGTDGTDGDRRNVGQTGTDGT
jgi:hypothetical protein